MKIHLLVFVLVLAFAVPAYKAAQLGERCESNEDCQLDRPGRLSYCQFILFVYMCGCRNGQNHDGICKTGKKLGAVCLNDDQCWEMGGLSDCQSFRCGCREGSLPKEDRSGCQPTKKLGDQCEVKWECPDAEFEFSDCLNGTCQCIGDRYNNSEGTRCLQNTDLGGRCNEDLECQLGAGGELSECVGSLHYNKKCKCSEEKGVDVDGHCEKFAENLGDTCRGDQQCQKKLTGLVDCIDNSCSCREGRIPNEDGKSCRASKRIGEECSVKWECPDSDIGTGWSECIDNVCTCDDPFPPNADGTRCVSPSNLDRWCRDDVECQFGDGGELSECIWGEGDSEIFGNCRCKLGSAKNSTSPPMTCVREAYQLS